MMGIAVACLVILGIYTIQARAVLAYPLFVPISNMEEASYTHIVVRNFLDFGFWRTVFLQDVSSSFDPNDHPFIYNHMPPGHELLLALLAKMFDRDYTVVHLIQFSVLPIGFVFYYFFVRRLLQQIGLVGAGFIAVFVLFWQLMTNLSHPHTSPYLLFMFAPLLLVARRNETETGKGFYGWIAAVLLLAASWILDYVLLSSVMMSWVLLCALKLWPLKRHDVLAALAVMLLGIVLHLVQNTIYLGPNLFLRELTSALGNRLFGVPSTDALVDFYQDAAILHHGARPISIRELAAVIVANAGYPGAGFVVLAVVFCGLLLTVVRSRGRYTRIRLTLGCRRACSFFVRSGIWVLGTLLTPVVLFPAFSQDMTLHGLVHSYLLAIPFMAAIFWTIALGVRVRRKFLTSLKTKGSDHLPLLRGRTILVALPGPGHRVILNITLMTIVVSLVIVALSSIAIRWGNDFREVRALYSNQDIARSFAYLEALRKFDDGMFMTNINTPLIGFFTRQPGFGVCGGESINKEGRAELRHCRIAMMRNSARYTDQRPRYFFFFTTHFPGFATCRPLAQKVDPSSGLPGDKCYEQQRKRLAELFSVSFDSPEVTVFDLDSRRGIAGRN
jgi:hypothetical protein